MVNDHYVVVRIHDSEIVYRGTSLRKAAVALVGRTVHGRANTELGAWGKAVLAAEQIRQRTVERIMK